MGCDIHLWVEKRVVKCQYGEDVWETVDHPDGRWYSGRNYDLFAILANVRNGRGFAGIRTGGGFIPILPEDAETDESRSLEHGGEPVPFCRGVPQRASDEYHAEVFRWSVDGHSHSWLTLSELLTYDWHNAKTTKRGCVSGVRYARMKRDGQTAPDEWCGDISGPGIRVVSVAEADRLIAEGHISAETEIDYYGHPVKPSTSPSYYVNIDWDVAYADAAGGFVTKTIPELKAYAEANSLAHDDLRIVFFFDN